MNKLLNDVLASHTAELEALVRDALSRVMIGRTSLVIAHRLSTVLAADTILVLDHGRIVERGSHADLILQGGLYSRLYETQFRAALQTVEAG